MLFTSSLSKEAKNRASLVFKLSHSFFALYGKSLRDISIYPKTSSGNYSPILGYLTLIIFNFEILQECYVHFKKSMNSPVSSPNKGLALSI
jgi:hypothetical protein